MRMEFPTFRRAFLTGVVVLAPIFITAWVFISLFQWVDGRMKPYLLQIPFFRDTFGESGVTGLGFLAAMVLVVVVGLFANNLLGRAVLGGFDRVMAKIPWIKGVYKATQEISGVVFGERSAAFRKVVLFEYPRPGIYALGFVTLELSGTENMYHVFLPTTPNPTSGFFLMVPSKDAIQLPITIEEGLKLAVSGGAVVSPSSRQHLDEALQRMRG